MKEYFSRAGMGFLVLVWLAVSCARNEPAAETILFLGDSITEADFFVKDIEQALIRESGGKAPRVINRGRGSETVSGLTEAGFPGKRPYLHTRLDKELRRSKPDWVVACYGMNCGLYQPFDETRFAAYRKGVERLIEKVHACGARIILFTPPPYAGRSAHFPDGMNDAEKAGLLEEDNNRALQELADNPERFGYRKEYVRYNQVLERYADWLKSLSARSNVWVVDIRGAMTSQLDACYDDDPVHPNRFGHNVIAETFLKEWPRIKNEAVAKADSP